MVAGASAGQEARRALLSAQAHEEAAARERARAGRFDVARRSEASTARTLAPLTVLGYLQLADRRWPGSRSANVDLLLVGPGGVLIIDTKAWAEPAIHRGRLYRGQEDVTEELDGLHRLVDVTEADLVEVGLAPCEVVPVLALSGRRGVDERIGRVHVLGEHDLPGFVALRGTRLTQDEVDVVTRRVMDLFPPMSAAEPAAPLRAIVPDPILPADPALVRRTVEQALPAGDGSTDERELDPFPRPAPPPEPAGGRAASDGHDLDRSSAADQEPEDDLALLSVADVQHAVLQAALAQPIESWMSFLHPDQARLVRRSFNGPARVRGAAGTGKTVVGLHRAAYLAATRPGRILYTSFVRTLPLTLGQLYARLSPGTTDRVDFVGVHAFALSLLRGRGTDPGLDLAAARRAYERAWARTGSAGALRQVPDQRYWQDEIQYVIKGRGITRFEDYAALDRVGRRHPLIRDQRLAVWDLFVAYQEDLARTGARDMADVVLMAERSLREDPLAPGYAAVVVDEVQDLTCATVRMLHALVGDAPDGLLLIGDGQQSVYPGGFTLTEAGVAVTGRAHVLRRNYRNTEQILAAASDVVARDVFSDLEGLEEMGDRDVECVRTGPSPVRVEARDVRSHDTALLSAIETAVREAGVDHGDVAVLAPYRATVRHYLRLLASAGVPAVEPEDYDGRPVPRVKVGTFKRAKGLEFKHVMLPQVSAGQPRQRRDESDHVYRERVELARRELFVGMTRARDGLWLGHVTG